MTASCYYDEFLHWFSTLTRDFLVALAAPEEVHHSRRIARSEYRWYDLNVEKETQLIWRQASKCFWKCWQFELPYPDGYLPMEWRTFNPAATFSDVKRWLTIVQLFKQKELWDSGFSVFERWRGCDVTLIPNGIELIVRWNRVGMEFDARWNWTWNQLWNQVSDITEIFWDLITMRSDSNVIHWIWALYRNGLWQSTTVANEVQKVSAWRTQSAYDEKAS